jgi:predicted RecB family nuclease
MPHVDHEEEDVFPPGIIADMLNLPTAIIPRQGEVERKLPYVHVSDLLKNSPSDQFCEREVVLRHFDPLKRAKGSVPAKMKLLWDTGNLLANNVVIDFLLNTDYGKYVWGDWICTHCEAKTLSSYRPKKCSSCKGSKFIYSEVDLRAESVRLVGHPDLLIKLPSDRIIIYEIKTFNRSDTPFDSLAEPLGDHRLQASYYYWMLRESGQNPIDKIRFIYIDRSLDNMYKSKPFKEFVVDLVSKDRIQRGIELARKVKKAIEQKKLPDRICKEPLSGRALKCAHAAGCFARLRKTIDYV